MSETHINKARLNKCIDTILNKDYNKIMLKPKLIKITDVEPEKTYFSRWHKYGYQLKPEDLKHHWDHSCFKDKIEDKSCSLITHYYEKLLENVFNGIMNLQLSI
ncbi:hypothetical protein RhiirC2_793600 [Rhizophagus irregularis]|uniref:Uncharacterized protein n=1 Tax=Rhizophagus irregularis TaxID=588596 RepID=A0A2N1MF17_9GLOM|nr:hypothetical protein RhiirC2_793600 [Rhizophagus irregularis]